MARTIFFLVLNYNYKISLSFSAHFYGTTLSHYKTHSGCECSEEPNLPRSGPGSAGVSFILSRRIILI